MAVKMADLRFLSPLLPILYIEDYTTESGFLTSLDYGEGFFYRTII